MVQVKAWQEGQGQGWPSWRRPGVPRAVLSPLLSLSGLKVAGLPLGFRSPEFLSKTKDLGF